MIWHIRDISTGNGLVLTMTVFLASWGGEEDLRTVLLTKLLPSYSLTNQSLNWDRPTVQSNFWCHFSVFVLVGLLLFSAHRTTSIHPSVINCGQGLRGKRIPFSQLAQRGLACPLNLSPSTGRGLLGKYIIPRLILGWNSATTLKATSGAYRTIFTPSFFPSPHSGF